MTSVPQYATMGAMASKSVCVSLTLEWVFTEKEWSEEKDHLHNLSENVRLVVGDDIYHALFMLNDVATPKVKKVKVEQVC